MGMNYKSYIMNKNRAGIERSLSCPFPKLSVFFQLLNQFLVNPRLSYKNCLYAQRCINKARAIPDWQDIESQKHLNFLDEQVGKAKERVAKRKEKRAAKKAEALGIKAGKPGRPPKNAPVRPPAEGPEAAEARKKLWQSMLEEKKP